MSGENDLKWITRDHASLQERELARRRKQQDRQRRRKEADQAERDRHAAAFSAPFISHDLLTPEHRQQISDWVKCRARHYSPTGL